MIAQPEFDPDPELARRELLRRRCERGPRQSRKGGRPRKNAAAEVRAAEHELCRRSVLRWIGNWVWTLDPREPEPALREKPFIPWDRQVDLLRWLEERETSRTHGTVLKGRDVGVTWLCIAFAVHRWLFRPGTIITFGSRREDLVDDLGNVTESLLPKARFILERLPPWMLPPGYDPMRHTRFMSIRNPVTGSQILGETGVQIGRGGRSSMVFIDEAAYVPHLEQVYAAVSANSDVQIDVSTPNRPGDPFDQRCDRPDLTNLFEIDWRDDPRKSPGWAEAERERLGPIVFAREYERDRKSSVEGLVIAPAWIDACRRLGQLIDVPRGPTGISGQDVGAGGSGRSVHITRFGPVVLPPAVWGDPNTTKTALRALEETRKAGAELLNYDCIGVGHGITGALQGTASGGITVQAINVGMPASGYRRWPDGKTSQEKFANLRAELWWIMRDRCQKTWEYVLWLEGDWDNGREHPLDELLVLPSGASRLAVELGRVTWHPQGSTNKIMIESKQDMARRGVPSPDEADALALTWIEPLPKMRVVPLRGV